MGWMFRGLLGGKRGWSMCESTEWGESVNSIGNKKLICWELMLKKVTTLRELVATLCWELMLKSGTIIGELVTVLGYL